jgi:hypothetical protein
MRQSGESETTHKTIGNIAHWILRPRIQDPPYSYNPLDFHEKGISLFLYLA